MSAKIERRSRMRKKSEENEISIKQSRSIISANDQKRKLVSSSMINFDSETFSSSSPSKVDINSQKKFHKKRIRSTQDFNQLNNSLTSQDSDESTKNKPKKTKKSKKAYKLPRISQMAVDFAADAQNIFSDDELIRKKRTKGKVKSDSDDVLLQENRQAQRKKGNKIKENNVDMLLDSNKLQSKESDKKDSNTEEYKSANSITDSDEEIVFKCKTKLQKRQKKRIESNVFQSDILNMNSRSNNTTQSCLSTPSSNKKREQNKKLSMKTTKCETTPTVCRYNQGDMKQSISSKPLLRVSCTPYSKNKLSNTPLVDYKERVTRSIVRQSRINLSQEFSPGVEIKVKNGKRNRTASLTASIDFEMDFDCDDVFDETLKKSEENTAGNQKGHSEDATITNTRISIKPRKSVRFQSPEQNIRRETVILSKTTVNKTTVEPNDCDTLTQSIVEDHRPSNGSIRRNSTFEITSPHISQVNLPDVSQIGTSFNKSLNKSGNSSNTDHKSTNASIRRNSTFEITSPVINQGIPSDIWRNKISLSHSLNKRSTSSNKIHKSSNEPIKRSSTFEITSPVTNQVNLPDVAENNILIDQSLNKHNTSCNKIHKSSNELIKRSSTFEIASSVTNQVNLPDVSQNKISLDQTLNKRSTSSNKIRKSSNEPIKRSSTFEITSPVTNQVNLPDVSQTKISIDQSLKKRSTSSNKIYKSSNRLTKRSSTFEITSPVTNQVNLPDVSQNKTSLDQTLNKHSTSSSNKNLRRTRLQENSVIDLTTPTPLKNVNSLFASSRETFNISGIGSLEKLHRQSTFSMDDEATAVHTDSAYVADNNETITNASHAPSLVRTATFTKKGENVEHSRDLQPDLIYSPLPSDTSYSKLIDTSKVNKRRRWDKSRLSVSFLSDSLDIGNISAPWQEDDSIKLNTSKANEQEHSMDLKFSPNINNSHTNQVTFKNTPTSVSATSTPYPKSKSTLLKQALLKDNRNVTMNESKNRTVLNEKPLPKVARTKIPNFARIHQRALDKMENIKEMSERKAARAKLLLSGHKPPAETSQKPSSKRKELKFSPDKLKSSANKDKNTNRNMLTSHISVTKIKAISPSKSNPKVMNKENNLTPVEKKKDVLKTKSLQPKPKVPKAVAAGKNGFTRFGFKMGPEGVKKATRDEQVKAVVSKSKVMKNTIEERRNIIQGVRSNRRFELLMNMRIK